MNTCILMAEIIKEPELRFTPDGLELAEMLVQFSGTREGDPPATLRVIGWGNLAKEVQQNYHTGDRVLVEGRLGMHTIDRPEGFKEKRAELTLQKIYPLMMGGNANVASEVPVTTTVPVASIPKANSTYESPLPTATPATKNVGVASQNDFSQPIKASPNYEPSSYPTAAPKEEPDVDDIPF